MLEPPDIQHTQIAACLEKKYGLSATEIKFLPLGADVDTAVFHVTTENAQDFFSNFGEAAYQRVE